VLHHDLVLLDFKERPHPFRLGSGPDIDHCEELHISRLKLGKPNTILQVTKIVYLGKVKCTASIHVNTLKDGLQIISL
jgi:hypothetical protein